MKVRAPFVLALTAGFFVAATMFGFRLLMADVGSGDVAPTCENRSVSDGEKLTSNLVAVNVFNASNRSGLANRVSINLQRRGFLAGDIGNSTSQIKTDNVTILTRDKNDPRVRLVAANFSGTVEYAQPDISASAGVIVIVGDDFNESLGTKKSKIKSDRTITTCVPLVLDS